MDEMRKALDNYLEINDFESALRLRGDQGGIYNNEAIMGWIRSTFTVAWNQALQSANPDESSSMLQNQSHDGGNMADKDEGLRKYWFKGIGPTSHCEWSREVPPADERHEWILMQEVPGFPWGGSDPRSEGTENVNYSSSQSPEDKVKFNWVTERGEGDELAKLKEAIRKCAIPPDLIESHIACLDNGYRSRDGEVSRLEAQLHVARDAQLRTYDGLAQKADRVDKAEAEVSKLTSKLDKAMNEIKALRWAVHYSDKPQDGMTSLARQSWLHLADQNRQALKDEDGRE